MKVQPENCDPELHGLVVNVCTRLMKLSPDAVRGFERVLGRFEFGQRKYGPLDAATDERDWNVESIEELLDMCVYRGLSLVGRRSESSVSIDLGVNGVVRIPAPPFDTSDIESAVVSHVEGCCPCGDELDSWGDALDRDRDVP